MKRAELLLGVSVLFSAPLDAAAERRDGAQVPAVLQVVLDAPTRFGALLLSPRAYRVTIAGENLVFADPTTMVTAGSVAAESSEQATVVERPSATVTRDGAQVIVSVRYADRLVRASGTVVTPPAGEESWVSFGDKQAAALPGGAGEEASAAQLVKAALQRYLGGVKHCGDLAHRHRWETDDPRFVNCVCPIALRWRMPKLSRELEAHQILAAAKNGFTLTVSPAGKVLGCRVWTGAQPPVPPTPPAAPAPVETPSPPPPAEPQP